MFKYIKLPTLLVILPVMSFSGNITIPKKVSIEFSGSGGTKSTMKFSSTKHNYNIAHITNLPMYKIIYQSNGTINNNHLNTYKFSESRNGHLVSSALFNPSTKQVTYGKINTPKKAQIIGKSYDSISLVWEIAFNPNLPLDTFQLTTGKGIYLIHAGNSNISTIKQSRNIAIAKKLIPIELYDLAKIKGSKTPIQIGYSKQYNNLPVYMKLRNKLYDIEFIATSITIDGKKIL
ncbi:MAG: hypothetical protein GKC53_00210 [Neisseriaceae bacterium]|nr:MAG: hypothetical protein GKC53_00210 [Neisseriaceae bacterium]